MKKLKIKSVLYSYLASFISVSIIFCSAISMVTYGLGAQELRKSAETEQHKRLMLAVEDFDAQFGYLQEISYTIQTTECYQPYVVAKNPYYKVELIEDLRKFNNYSSLYDQYVLHYEGEDGLYLRTGKRYLGHYAEQLGLEDSVALAKAMNECDRLTFFALEHGALAMFPLRMTPTTRYSGNATLSFLLTNDALIRRARLVSGEKFTRMAVYYGKEFVAGSDDIENEITVQYGRFTLGFDKAELNVGANSHFLHLTLLLTAVLAVVLCILAAYVAVYNYRPIGNLARRHNLKSGSNELEHLDQTLIDIEGKLRMSQKQLNERVEQFKTLRKDLQLYFVMQIVRGEVGDTSIERMREAGMYFPGKSFYTFILRMNKKIGYEEIEQITEELTDDQAAFYVVPFGGNDSYAVLVNTNNGEELQDILADAYVDAQVFGGKETEVVSEIPSLLFDALTAASPSCIKPSDIARCREDERLHTLRKALEIGDEAQAMESLHEYIDAYADGDQTIQQLIHNNVTAILLSASYEANMNVPHAFLRGKYETWSLLEGWVSALCNSKENLTPSDEHQIIRYLREHMLDYNLSLESVAEHFHRSTRQITRIVQAETGGSYKEFILRLRMEYAKEMLRNGASVAETCDAVCYVSRSHFIKTFTTYTGMTPSRFKEQEMKAQQEE